MYRVSFCYPRNDLLPWRARQDYLPAGSEQESSSEILGHQHFLPISMLLICEILPLLLHNFELTTLGRDNEVRLQLVIILYMQMCLSHFSLEVVS